MATSDPDRSSALALLRSGVNNFSGVINMLKTKLVVGAALNAVAGLAQAGMPKNIVLTATAMA
jgi:hypothetical protein